MMPILDRLPEVLPSELAELIDQLQDERVELIDGMRETQLMARVLYQQEAQRLEVAAGPDDPRVQALLARAQYCAEVAAALEVESQIAKIRPVNVAPSDAVLHGRLVDAGLRAFPDAAVRLVGEGGEDLGVPAVRTDAGGYYAFVLSREIAARLGPERRLMVALGEQRERFIPASVDAITLAEGTRTQQDVILRPDEIERVRGPVDFGVRSERPPAATPPAKASTQAGKAPSAGAERARTRGGATSTEPRPRKKKRRPRK